METIVCIKQVPGTAKVDIDKKTGVLKRDGIDAKLNPFDLYAIETALRLREEYGGVVRAVAMGPEQAAEILREAYMMGVDEGVLLSDTAFAGSDVLATSRALAGAITLRGFDLIICGKQTTDGDTAQVGPETAEFLNIPHVANVTQIVHIKDDVIRVEADMTDSVHVLDIPFPCLITVEKDIYTPRLPSYLKKLESADREIDIATLSQLDDHNPANYGLDGSPTRVERIFPPESSSERITVEGDADDMAAFIYQKLKELKYIDVGMKEAGKGGRYNG